MLMTPSPPPLSPNSPQPTHPPPPSLPPTHPPTHAHLLQLADCPRARRDAQRVAHLARQVREGAAQQAAAGGGAADAARLQLLLVVCWAVGWLAG